MGLRRWHECYGTVSEGYHLLLQLCSTAAWLPQFWHQYSGEYKLFSDGDYQRSHTDSILNRHLNKLFSTCNQNTCLQRFSLTDRLTEPNGSLVMVFQTSPNFNVFTKCSNAHLSKVSEYCVIVYSSMSALVPADCSTAALQHCTGCFHPSVACGSCRKLLITVTRAAANSDHDTIFFCWCWCSSDASTDTIWFLLTSLCQGCQGIFRFTVVDSI